jgi:translation initiation factor 1 (eIF-1/SUI1)
MSKKSLVKQVNYDSDEDKDSIIFSNNESKKDLLFEKTDQSVFKTIVNTNPVDLLNINDFTVNIRVNQRNSKKYITTIENIPLKFFENKEETYKMIKKMRDTLASRATIKKDIIEISGNKIKLIIPIIQEFTNCSLSDIKVHGYV